MDIVLTDKIGEVQIVSPYNRVSESRTISSVVRSL